LNICNSSVYNKKNCHGTGKKKKGRKALKNFGIKPAHTLNMAFKNSNHWKMASYRHICSTLPSGFSKTWEND
jgi:hypothetical protein